MKNISLMSLLISLVIFTSCKDKVTNPPDTPLPEGYQQDVPWPSLADSPWPMYHGDAQLTGRSKFVGPNKGIIEKIIPAIQMEAGMVVGFDSTLYYTATGELFAADYQGNIKWKLKLSNEITTTPIVGSDTIIYLAGGNLNSVFAINKNGTIKWEYKVRYPTWNAHIGIDMQNNLYSITGTVLTVLSKSGKLLWQLSDSRFQSGYDVTYSFSPDGKILYLQGNTVSVLAIDISAHAILWNFGDKSMNSGAVVDNQGNIYILPNSIQGEDNYFYSITPTGKIRWKYKHVENNIMDNVEPAVDKEGNIYFGSGNLYSLDYSGNERWKVDLEGYHLISGVLVDKVGNIFTCVGHGLYNLKILSFSKDGEKRWEIPVTSERGFESAAISEEGTLFLPNFRSNNFLIIK